MTELPEVAPQSSPSSEPRVVMQGITKVFSGLHANDGIDFTVSAGEVHALLGENGAGKTTLVKVLYGFHRPDAGTIRVDGRPVDFRSPREARNLGIGMVFQHFMLIPALTVLENVALFLPRLPAILDHRTIVRQIEEVSGKYGLSVDPWAPVSSLSIGEQQKVEILKLILAQAQILILDEPTRVLAPQEIEGLFRVLAHLRKAGYAVVFITHKVQEVLACADRVTVLRRGMVAGTLTRTELTEQGLVTLMFGDALPDRAAPRRTPNPQGAPPLLALRGINTSGDGVRLQGITLTVEPGEIVGVAGVSGNGQRELGDVILGLIPCLGGDKVLGGQNATGWSVDRIRRSGVAFVPEDPLRMLIAPSLSVLENMALGDTHRYARRLGVTMDWTAVRRMLEQVAHRLAFETPPPDVPARTLSGGNVQRLSLLRELAREPTLVVALYPTRGLDMRSAMAARGALVGMRGQGVGVLLISEDLSELFALCDRLVVLNRGRIVGTKTPQDTTVDEIGRLMTGGPAARG